MIARLLTEAFGFIRDESGVGNLHRSSVRGVRAAQEGQRVEFTTEDSIKAERPKSGWSTPATLRFT
jgi:cold shock CspA family protein